MCIANVHSTLFQKHSVSQLSTLCKAQGLWLHLEGHALSALTLLPKSRHMLYADCFSIVTSTDDESKVQRGDSMTLTFGSWVRNSYFPVHSIIRLFQVGIPAVPFVTIYKADQPSLAQMAGLGVVNPSVRLSCLPLWCVLRSLGQDQVNQVKRKK